jgi:hypothetical protein
MRTVKFLGYTCNIEEGQYSNGRIALELVDAKTGEPVAVATVNIPKEDIEEGEVIIKDYSENEGIYQVLLDAKIIGPKRRIVNTGWSYSNVCHYFKEK